MTVALPGVWSAAENEAKVNCLLVKRGALASDTYTVLCAGVCDTYLTPIGHLSDLSDT